ncbi:MAG TPA: ABC transporter substrate-binding protein [Phototrophicaceae bacterium]|nr:ABC transporter substrate-binding protein [Phototrophicaceae bacterium]
MKRHVLFSLTAIFALVAFSNVVVLAQDATAEATSAATTANCTTYHEAPELAAEVAAGKLPPVQDRLPKDPMVDPVADQIGMYGGTLQTVYEGTRLAEFRQYGYEGLVRWNVDGTQVIPDIAESWDINDGGKEYVFHLRDGLKWSDGQPFTADDILFWWNDVETDPEINPGGPHAYFVVNGEKATVKEIDPLTVSFSWSQPDGLFLQNLSASYGVRVTQFAKHYLQQFSKKSDPDNVAKLMAADGATSYGDWWTNHVGSYGDQAEYNDPNRPFMQPWIPQAPYIGAQQFTFVRNPYYFKVDADCNQLPYIDNRTFTLTTDPQVVLLQTLGGQNFISSDDIAQPTNKSVFFDNTDKGNYRFINVTSSNFNTMLLHLNYNDADPVKAQVFNNLDFRIGLSEAMDRQNVIDTVYVGQGKPFQAAPRPESPFYNDKLATEYTNYDVDAANAELDKVLPNKGADGYRLGPDGNPFSFTVTVDQGFRPDWVDDMQIIQKDWQAVGINAQLDVVSDDTWQTREQDPKLDAYVWTGENGLGQLPMLALSQQTSDFLPIDNGGVIGNGWWAWFRTSVDPTFKPQVDPVTPPQEVQRMFQISTQIKSAVTADDQNKLMSEFFNDEADQFLTIGLSLPAGDYHVVNNTVRNVPDTVITGWLYPGFAPANYETFYIDPSYAK